MKQRRVEDLSESFFEWIISGESQASINAYGRENIDSIFSICDNMDIFVEKKFEGNYLYD